MKKILFFLTAVLLCVVLLFFLKEKGGGLPEKEPGGTGTPTGTGIPEQKEPKVLKNVWILSSAENGITFFYEGEEQTLSTKGRLQEFPSECVGDLTVQAGEITALLLKPDKVTAKVLRVDDGKIELEGYGVLPLSEEFTVYRLYDGVGEEPTGKLLVGSSGNEFVLENGVVCASLLRNKPELKKIRVLIGTEGYEGYFHDTVELTADCNYTVICGEEEEAFQAGEVCKVTKKSFREQSDRRVVVPEKTDGKITFCNLKRAGGAPAYRGCLEIEGREEGLLVVNEVTLEEYLYAVIPSEMPSDFGTEALKAQAICARSYAYTGLMANRYATYGAHVDDSVTCQVYNNTGETEAAVLAVKDTHGQVLYYEGEIAQCYYFSTSSGHTASAADVWENAEAAEYLPAKETPYDADSPWYRWQTFLPLDSLEERVEDALKTRYRVVPEQILTYDTESGAFCSLPVKKLGKLKSIQVYDKGDGEIATGLLVVGSKGVFLVKNEYNIRTVLAPVKERIYRENGEAVSGAKLLPSAFVTLQKGTYREETGYLVTGGGYGHGVGMSQCGADAMAQEGYSCEEIIEEYYPGTEIGFIYE